MKDGYCGFIAVVIDNVFVQLGERQFESLLSIEGQTSSASTAVPQSTAHLSAQDSGHWTTAILCPGRSLAQHRNFSPSEGKQHPENLSSVVNCEIQHG